jgi:triosephosphate isomerase
MKNVRTNVFVIGNWKMNGSLALCNDFIENIEKKDNVGVVVCPPLIYAQYLSQRSTFEVGAQDCSQFMNGAYTGDVSCQMMCEIGVRYVIVGHSERIKHHNESNDIILQKLERCNENSIIPILCVDGENTEVVKKQMDFFHTRAENAIIAYEPSYCIGTGITPTNEDIDSILRTIKEFGDFKAVYGGSVNVENIEILRTIPSLDGVLVGGASLNVKQFNKIIKVISE